MHSLQLSSYRPWMNQHFPCPDLSPHVMKFIKYTVPFAMIDPPNNSDWSMDSHIVPARSVPSPGKQILPCSSQMWTRENVESRTLAHRRSLRMSRCSSSSHSSNLWADRGLSCAHTQDLLLLGVLFFMCYNCLPGWIITLDKLWSIHRHTEWWHFRPWWTPYRTMVPVRSASNIIAG